MSPCVLTHAGGASEHWNPDSGAVWLRRLRAAWPHAMWINPMPEAGWVFSQSVAMIEGILPGAWYPMTLAGIEAGRRSLAR
jgi:uncharacterized protein with von Willebrand factor type A (vWA) domain